MADVVGSGIARTLVDRDGDPLDDGEGRLNINATLEAATVNIGDVDINSVPAPLSIVGGGTEAAALRVTLANDSTGVITIDGSVTVNTISGFATSDKQPSLGTAGSASANVITVQGIASMTPLTVDLAGNNDVTVTGTVGHDITGMVSDMDADVGTTAEKIHSDADVAIKRIDIQAHRDNTGFIYVGDSGVAGNGSGGGIALAAGDFYSLDIDNTGDVYVAASVADEDVSYIYYT